MWNARIKQRTEATDHLSFARVRQVTKSSSFSLASRISRITMSCYQNFYPHASASALLLLTLTLTLLAVEVAQGQKRFGSGWFWPSPFSQPDSPKPDTSFPQFPPLPSSFTSSGGSGSNSNEAYLRQSGQCCSIYFKEAGKKCFDLKNCNNNNGGSSFGWTFNPASFGGPSQQDFQLQGLCNCMASTTFGGKKIGKLCCSAETAEPVEPEPEPDFGFHSTLQKPSIDFSPGPNYPQKEPPRPWPTQGPLNVAPDKQDDWPIPSPPPPSNTNPDDASIHSVEWTPAQKAAVLAHRNFHLLPKLDSCGVAKARSNIVAYIIGGVDAKFGEQPWMARLGILSPDPEEGLSFACGGTLINSRYVLTAAHCAIAPPLPPGYKVSSVRLGEYDQRQDPDCSPTECAPPVQDIDVEAVIPHELYSLKNHENDIALLRLAKPATLDPYVTPVCLPTHDFVTAEDTGLLTVAGWGRTRFDKEDGSNILQEVMVPIVSKSKCQSYFQELFGIIKDGRFCSGGDSGRDSCRGDSGGPIMGRVALKPLSGSGGAVSRIVQLGIVSIGREDSQCSMAGEGHLTLYTKLAHYLPWILDHIKP